MGSKEPEVDKRSMSDQNIIIKTSHMRLKILLSILALAIIFSPVLFRVIWRLANSGISPISLLADENVDRYVAENGLDSNDCMTPQTACREVQIALTKDVKQGVTIHIANGRYKGFKVGSDIKGTPQKRVVIQGDGDAVYIMPARLGPNNRGDSIYFYQASYVTLRQVIIENAYFYGIYMAYGNNNTLQNLTISKSGVSGVLTGSTQYLTIEDSRSSENEEHGIYVSTNTRGNIIRRNELYNNFNAGVQFNGNGKVTDNEISDNYIHNNGTGRKGAAVNLCGQNYVVKNNKIVNNTNNVGGIAIWTDNCSNPNTPANYLVANNTIVGNSGAAVQVVSPSGPITIRNNILSPTNHCGLELPQKSSVTQTNSDHNIFNSNDRTICVEGSNPNTSLIKWQSEYSKDKNSKVATLAELFVNPAANDYRLKPGSPAINTGLNLSEVATDIINTARPQGSKTDIGAYESLESQNDPPPPSQLTANLSAELAIDKPNPNAGETIALTATVTNKGPDTAEGVVAKDLLPTGLSFVSAATTTGSYDNTSGNWTINSLAKGAKSTLTLKATVGADTANGQKITNTVNVTQSSAIIDPASDNSASVTLTVINPIKPDPSPDPSPDPNSSTNQTPDSVPTQRPDVAIAYGVNNVAPSVGQPVNHTLNVANFGTEVARSVVGDFRIPEGQTFNSAATSRGVYDAAQGKLNLGDLQPGEKVTLTVNTTVKSNTTLGKTITNKATVSAANTTNEPTDNNSATVPQTISATPCTTDCSGGTTEPTASIENTDQLLPPIDQPTKSPGLIRRAWNSFTHSISNFFSNFRRLFGL